MKLIDLLESLNYTTDITWVGDIGKFTVNDYQYYVTVRSASSAERSTYVHFFGSDIKVGNVDFALLLPNGKTTQDAVGVVGGSALKVFSVVAQGVAELIDRHQYDMVLCVAKRHASPTNFDSRSSAYEIIVDRTARRAGMIGNKIYETPSEVVFVVYKPSMIDGMDRVKQHLGTL